MMRVETTFVVDGTTFNDLKHLNRHLGFDADQQSSRRALIPTDRYPESAETFYFGPGYEGEHAAFKVRLGDGVHRTIELDHQDVEANLTFVRDARRMADWVLFSFHCDHSATGIPPIAIDTAHDDDPPDHFVKLAHTLIDEGVDVVIGHGPHRDKGIEVYGGRPIFYSLGNFILQYDTAVFQPSEAYARYGLPVDATPSDFYYTRSRNETIARDFNAENWQSFIATLHFDGGKIAALRLHPIDLGIGLPIGQRGRPVMAEGKTREEVLDRIRRCSTPFGTEIDADTGDVLLTPR